MRSITIITLCALPLGLACKGDDAVYDDDPTIDDTDDDTGDGTDDTDTGSEGECGNGIHEGGEECDDGEYNADGADCTSACTINVCGDGFVRADVEECDDGNEADADGCEADCTLPACANGIIDPGEICYEEPVIHELGVDYSHVDVGDVDGDGTPDLVLVDVDDQKIGVLIGVGDGNFTPGAQLDTPEETNVVGLADFDDDGDLDLVAAAGNSFCFMLPCDPVQGRAAIWKNDGNGGFGDAAVFDVGDTNAGIAIADYDGDDRLDLALGDSNGNAVHVLLGQDDAPYLEDPITTDTAGSSGGIAAGDIDGDGVVDIITVGSSNARVLTGQGDGSFDEAPPIDVGGGLVDPWLVDLGADGHLDLIAADRTGTVANILVNQGDGTFGQRDETWAGWAPARMVVADLSQDGIPDFAVTNTGPNLTTIGRGLGDNTFDDLPALEPWAGPVDITAADFDGDGTMDLVITRPSRDAITVFLANP